MKTERIDELLPWRWPFRMVDRMVECEPHKSIVTTKRISADEGEGEDLDQGFPAVMLVEGMSQSAAARQFGIDRKTVAKMLKHAVPPGYRREGIIRGKY